MSTMIMPVNCPLCGDPLVNEFFVRLKKTCNNKLNHVIIYYSSFSNQDIVGSIKLILNTKNEAIWTLANMTFSIKNYNGSLIYLPWFEPDFSDYPRLLNKIKTYLVFS